MKICIKYYYILPSFFLSCELFRVKNRVAFRPIKGYSAAWIHYWWSFLTRPYAFNLKNSNIFFCKILCRFLICIANAATAANQPTSETKQQHPKTILRVYRFDKQIKLNFISCYWSDLHLHRIIPFPSFIIRCTWNGGGGFTWVFRLREVPFHAKGPGTHTVPQSNSITPPIPIIALIPASSQLIYI